MGEASLDELSGGLPEESALPAEIDSFVGRGELLAEVGQRMRESRLVTLVGPGGVGKTRVAYRAAEQARDSGLCPDGVVVVGLVGIEDDRVAARLLRAVGVTDTSADPLVHLVRHLRKRQMLLVIDNCEHVIDAAHEVVRALLRGAAGVRVLATSREALSVMGEHRIMVPPLPHEAGGGQVSDAMQLLIDRARARQFEIDPGDPAAVELVRMQAGLPLAIELAASHLGALSLTQVVAELGKPRPALGGGAVHAAMAVSYDRLTPPLQRMWALVAEMRGAVPAETVQAVGELVGIARDDALAMLVRLVNASIVQAATTAGGAARYSMLEPVRLYAHAVTPETERAELRRAHAEHFAELAARTRASWYGPREPQTLRALGSLAPNYGPALRTLIEAGEHTRAQEVALDVVWSRALIFDQQASESGRLMGTAVYGEPRDARTMTTVKVAAMAAWGYYVQGILGQGDEQMRQCDELIADLGEPEPIEVVLARATGMWVREDHEIGRQAVTLLHDAARTLDAAGRPGDAALATLMGCLGAGFHSPDAVELTRRHLREVEAAGAEWAISWALWAVALAELHQGSTPAAVEALRTAAGMQAGMGETWGLAWTTWLAAVLAAHRGHHADSATLFGASRTMHELTTINVNGLPGWLAVQHAAQTRCVRALGDDEARRLEAEGEALTYEQIGPRVLASLSDSHTQTNPGGLTNAEHEVVKLLVKGLTNAEIGCELQRATHTINSHVASALKRAREESGMPVRNRTELAAWYLRLTTPD